ncbi:MAG TPA: serine/threonine-protein kinase [Pirellulales bacterium]
MADGGQAIVCLARDNVRGEAVVVKVARTCSEKLTRQFQQESQLLAKARHPQIAAKLDYFERAGRPFLVLEYVKGKTLAAKLKSDGPLPATSAARISEQIAGAIQYVHEGMGCDGKVLIYRDLKPAHIILQDRDGTPRLLDFGMASDEASATGLESAAHRGTLEYMSPEQARAFLHGNSTVDRRSDIWALGAVLFELLTAQRLFGTRPNREGFASAEEWSRAIEDYLGPRTRDHGDWLVPIRESAIPEPLRKIIERCVENNPGARHRSAGELALALRQWRESVEVGAD